MLFRSLNRVGIDSATRLDLASQGFQPDSVPGDGVQVLVQRNGNVCFDCTALVHPDTVRQAVLAARVVGLDIAGIDLVAEDISQPLEAQGGAIVEVNAGPGLSTHLRPPGLPPTPVPEMIIEHLFGASDDGRIPVIGIAGTHGTRLASRVVAHLLQISGQKVGLACRDGLFLGTRCIDHRDSANFVAGQRLLLNRSIDSAVIENGLDVLLDQGLAYDWCQVGVVTRMHPECLVPERYIDSVDQLYKVFRTQVDIVLEGRGITVLNADDEQLVEMASLSKGAVMYFSANPGASVLAGHAASGGRSVVLNQGVILLREGDREVAQLRAGAVFPKLMPAEEFRPYLAAERRKWGEVIRARNIRV